MILSDSRFYMAMHVCDLMLGVGAKKLRLFQRAQKSESITRR